VRPGDAREQIEVAAPDFADAAIERDSHLGAQARRRLRRIVERNASPADCGLFTVGIGADGLHLYGHKRRHAGGGDDEAAATLDARPEAVRLIGSREGARNRQRDDASAETS